MKTNKIIQKIMGLALILALAFSVTACSASTNAASATTASAGDTAAAAPADEATTTVGTNVMADISGEIGEIIGNEVTIRLYVADETTEETEAVRTPGSGKGASSETIAKEYSGETVSIVIPVGTLIVKRVRSTEPTTASETTTGPVEEEIGLDDLTVGTQIKVYYKTGTEIIEKILAIPPRV
ncbi:MAG: hypothetical protein PHC86_00240 [Eubacteriales bacterium]|nr:hypothetical protein [Eubacteriales bacterium]